MAADDLLVSGDIELPPTARLPGRVDVYVRLLDVSLLDADATVVAEQVMRGARPGPGGVLPPFALRGGAIDPRASYTVEVHVDVDGDGAISVGDFVTMESSPVLTFGAGRTLHLRVHEYR